MPPGYQAPPPVVFRGRPPADRAELWVPLATDLAGGQRGAHNLTVVARLRPGVSIESADGDVKRIAAEVAREHPDYREWNARVVPLERMGHRIVSAIDEPAGRCRRLRAAAGVRERGQPAARARRRPAPRVCDPHGAGRGPRAARGSGDGRIARARHRRRRARRPAGRWRSCALIVALGPATIPGVRDAQLDLRALAFASPSRWRPRSWRGSSRRCA